MVNNPINVNLQMQRLMEGMATPLRCPRAGKEIGR
jgi:hypothetical protein